MKPVFANSNGNCLQASVASLLEHDISEVPHFRAAAESKGSTDFDELTAWLSTIGLYAGATTSPWTPPGRYISILKRGWFKPEYHAVVYKGEGLEHDPSGLDLSSWRLCTRWLLIPLDPAKEKRA